MPHLTYAHNTITRISPSRSQNFNSREIGLERVQGCVRAQLEARWVIEEVSVEGSAFVLPRDDEVDWAGELLVTTYAMVSFRILTRLSRVAFEWPALLRVSTRFRG